MTVLLVALDREEAMPPIGLAYIGAVLQQNNIDVKAYDLFFESHRQNFIEAFKDKPELVGFTSVPNYPYSIGLCSYVKKKSPSTKTIIGGTGVTNLGEHILSDFPYVDYMCSGEGEYTVLGLVKYLQEDAPIEDVPNLIFRENGKIQSTKFEIIDNLDSLPFPARDIFPKAENYGKDILSEIIAARGCPYPCNFCVYSESRKRQYHRRNMENIFKEIDTELEIGVKKFSISDELFPLHAKEFNDYEKKREPFGYSASLRLNLLVEHENDLEECAKNGLEWVNAGLESPSLNSVFNKGFGKETMEKALKILRKWYKKYKVHYSLSGIFYSKEQTLDGLRSDIKFLKEALSKNLNQSNLSLAGPSADIITHKIILHYGTEMYKKYKDEGLIEGGSYNDRELDYVAKVESIKTKMVSEKGPIEPEAIKEIVCRMNGKLDIYNPQWELNNVPNRIQKVIEGFERTYAKRLLEVEDELFKIAKKLDKEEGMMYELEDSLKEILMAPINVAWSLVNYSHIKKFTYGFGHLLNTFKRARQRIKLAEKLIEIDPGA